MAESTPVRVQVPAIGVDSALTELGVRADGTMEVPAEGFPAGWYSGAPTPVSWARPSSRAMSTGAGDLASSPTSAS